MRFSAAGPLPYCALLGTAVATVVGGQQLNLSMSALLLLLFASLANGNLAKLPLSRLAPLGWFFAATLPGTLLYALRGGSLGIPLIQYGGLVACWLAVWGLFIRLRYSPETIFDLYLQCATAAAVLAVVQEAAFLAQIPPLYDLHWALPGAAELDYAGPFLRVSFFTEPSYFAAFMTPALYMAVLRLTGHSRAMGTGRSLLLIAALVCTFSTIGYIGLALCILFALRLTLRNLLLGAVLLAGLGAIGSTNPALTSRLSAIPNALQSDLQGDENLSALINGLNLAITSQMLEDRPISGTGLGAYRVYSMDYLESFRAGNVVLIERVNAMMEQLTLADGGSMYLRLSTELGLSGLLLMAWLVRRHLRPADSPARAEMARAALLYMVVFSIRSGQLVRFEFVFFCALFALLRFELKPMAARPHPKPFAKRVLS
jgi:O-antigen ligase